ncbi:MAG: hypothetical protein F4Z01_06950 [Gammaproteobacteria bacterium]|nr:hypothetical protein [Gammaproteobacteria bacterium]
MDLDIFDGLTGNLTQAHIDNGFRDLCKECPVALSISEMLAEHKQEIGEIDVEVGTEQVRLHTGDWDAPFLVAEMDGQLKKWVDDFDRGKRIPTGKIYIKQDGFIEDVESNKVQRWRCGIHINA